MAGGEGLADMRLVPARKLHVSDTWLALCSFKAPFVGSTMCLRIADIGGIIVMHAKLYIYGASTVKEAAQWY